MSGHRAPGERGGPTAPRSIRARDPRVVFQGALLVLAVFYTLYFTRSLLLPIVLAVLLSFLLNPIVRALRDAHIPAAVGAALVMMILVGGAGFGVYRLATPAASWVANAPASLQRVEEKIRALRKPVEQVNEAAQKVENLADVGGHPAVPTVAIENETLSDSVVGHTQDFLGGAFLTVLLLYFLLSSEHVLSQKAIGALPRLGNERLTTIARKIERRISRYLISVTLLNVGLGVTVGFAMFLIGMPNPALWGAMVGLFNFVPYLGPLTSQIVLALVALATFDDLRWALLAPGIYFCIDVVESFVVTPMVLGKSLALNPIMILLAVTIWGWLWGVPGALIAVPVLVTMKILCEEIESLAVFAEILGS